MHHDILMIFKEKEVEFGNEQLFKNNTKLVRNCKTIADILVVSC